MCKEHISHLHFLITLTLMDCEVDYLRVPIQIDILGILRPLILANLNIYLYYFSNYDTYQAYHIIMILLWLYRFKY